MEYVKKAGAIIETLNEDGKLDNQQYAELSKCSKKMFEKKESEWVVKVLYVNMQTTAVWKDDDGEYNMITDTSGDFEFETCSCDEDCSNNCKLTFVKVKNEFKQKEYILKVVDYSRHPYIDVNRNIISDKAVRDSHNSHIVSYERDGISAFFKILDFDLLNNQGGNESSDDEQEPEPEPES
jgi:hypothetical protein